MAQKVQMAMFTMDNGLMIKLMDKETTFKLKLLHMKEAGTAGGDPQAPDPAFGGLSQN
jgi:hypothetical protein